MESPIVRGETEAIKDLFYREFQPLYLKWAANVTLFRSRFSVFTITYFVTGSFLENGNLPVIPSPYNFQSALFCCGAVVDHLSSLHRTPALQLTD
jgi:hypothetical protein